MRPSLFISDLHLSAQRPETNAAFFGFLNETAKNAEALYILGDLFDYWVGDDQLDVDPLAKRVADALRRTAENGVEIFFMHGNRDFLIGERFAREARLTILPDPFLLELDGERVLLLHGDTLCTDDIAYQAFRKQARDPAWQAALLAQPFDARVAYAHRVREQSTADKSLKPEDIMDVNVDAVADVFRRYGVAKMIHGHTHRVATHIHAVDGKHCTRWVLADWHDAEHSFALPEANSSADAGRVP